ncbi:hypothetical protein WSK_1732 [Novosphingobium sp. Rr 2-17]|nr:hypothetical protein WSK_1732 [Novosphingobium sp. Rr 2-17]
MTDNLRTLMRNTVFGTKDVRIPWRLKPDGLFVNGSISRSPLD